MRWSSISLLFLTGCPWIGGADLDERLDADGDGFESVAVGGPDCDDDEPRIHPDAQERCNGIDDDCDGDLDEGFDDAVDGGQIFTVDADGDGYGQQDGATLRACSAPIGYVDDATDCDDGDVRAFPGADERCNGLDDDCDRTVDNDPIDGQPGYVDADGDGFGDPTTLRQVCALDGTVDNGMDCDDTDATLHPDTSWYDDDDGDGYGDPVNFVQSSCEGPKGAVPNDGDCNDDDAQLNPETEWFEDLDSDGYGGVLLATQCQSPTLYALLVGEDCDDTNPAVNPDTEWFEDSDGDGYPGTVLSPPSCVAPPGGLLVPVDCDDANTDISPGAQELCSTVGIDDDCDGLVDDADTNSPPADGEPWFEDGDGDGWGAGPVVMLCDGPPPYTSFVERDGDCNDYRPTQHPETVWVLDADGDGFWPTSGTTVQQCEPPDPSYYELELVIDDPFDIDCDDSDDTVYPRADEFCDDIDSDCDGEINDDDSTGERTWYRDDDYDGYGDVGTTLACFQPYGYADNTDDCDDNDDQTYPGAPDPCYDGEDRNCDGDDEDDCDGDGFLPLADGGEDCDDLDPGISPDLPTTRSVPGDHGTVQEALDAACPYDTVLLGAGVFSEALVAPRPVHLLGEGRGVTHLDGGGVDRPLTAAGGSVAELTLQNGSAANGGCLYQNQGAPLALSGVELTSCVASSTGGAMNVQSIDVDLTDVQIVDSTAATGGGLSFTLVTGTLADVSCTDCSGSSGGAVSLVVSDVDIDGLTLVRPTALASVFLGTSVAGVWTDLTFEQSESLSPGLLLVGAGDNAPLLVDGLVMNQPATTDGGSLAVWSGATTDLTLTNVVVRDADIDATYVPAKVFDIQVTNGQAVISGVRVENVAATSRFTTSLNAGTILLEHGTFVETEGGLTLDAQAPGAIEVRNTVVAYDRGDALSIEGELPTISGSNLYGNVTDWPGGTSYLGADANVSITPGFLSWGPTLPSATWDLRLSPASAQRDAGVGVDLDGSVADIGAYGGPAVSADDLLDTDGDGLYDSWEVRFGLDPLSDSTTGDADGDGLDNLGEANAGTWPDSADTDGDGLDDLTELLGGSDPVDANSP